MSDMSREFLLAEIKRQCTEIERLRAEISHWRESAKDHVSKSLYEAHTEELRAEIKRLQNECYKKCGVCEFDYGRAAPPLARSGDSD
jgi:predicted RNase H-like nuclease (RuvC/YqgF family)